MTLLAVLAFPLILLVWWSTDNRDRRQRGLVAAARRLGGKVQPKGEAVAFAVDGVAGRLAYEKSVEGWVTSLQLDWDPGERRLHVMPHGPPALADRFRDRLHQTGDAEFGADVAVLGGPPEWLAHALDSRGRAYVRGILALGGSVLYEGFRLAVTADGFRLEVHRDLLRDPRQTDRLLDCALGLFHLFRETANLSLTVTPTHEGERCPVCADRLGEEVQACPSCGTLHHPECWAFLGGCAVLGCGARDPRARPQEPEAW